jgi:hypothetical protein
MNVTCGTEQLQARWWAQCRGQRSSSSHWEPLTITLQQGTGGALGQAPQGTTCRRKCPVILSLSPGRSGHQVKQKGGEAGVDGGVKPSSSLSMSLGKVITWWALTEPRETSARRAALGFCLIIAYTGPPGWK